MDTNTQLKEPMTGDPVNTAVNPQVAGDAEPKQEEKKEPLYKSFIGELKTPEELVDYAKSLEKLVVQAKAHTDAKQNEPSVFQATAPQTGTVTKTMSAKEQFADLIYNKPDEAFELAVNEAKNRMDHANAEQRRREDWWRSFYDQNEDLKRNDRIVQLIFKEREQEIRKLPTGEAVAELLAKESRTLIDRMKKDLNGDGTRIDSGNAVTLGASGESVPKPPQNQGSNEPLSLVEQLQKQRLRRKK